MSRDDGGWDVQGPWEAVFTRSDGNVLERTVYGSRNEAVGHLAGRIVWYRHNVQGEWALSLTGPDGVTLTGDAVYEGIFIRETWLEMPTEDGIAVLPLLD